MVVLSQCAWQWCSCLCCNLQVIVMELMWKGKARKWHNIAIGSSYKCHFSHTVMWIFILCEERKKVKGKLLFSFLAMFWIQHKFVFVLLFDIHAMCLFSSTFNCYNACWFVLKMNISASFTVDWWQQHWCYYSVKVVLLFIFVLNFL